MQTKRRQLWCRPPAQSRHPLASAATAAAAAAAIPLISLLIISSFQPAQCQHQQHSTQTSRLLFHPPNNQRHLQLLQNRQQQANYNTLVSSSAQVDTPLRVRSALPSSARQHQSENNFDNVIESTSSSSFSSPAAEQLLDAELSSTDATYNGPAASLFEEPQSAAMLGAGPRCQLPSTWAGRWYQANREPIRVTNTEISDKGVCRDQKGDKYLFEMAETSSRPGCIVCLVINERHLNVLQYKESNCQPVPPASSTITTTNNLTTTTTISPTAGSSSDPLDADHSLLEKACSDITGDAQLESMFRLDTPAIECPITGQHSFTYDYGSRLCRDPASSLNSCIDKKQLNFKFSACPDVPGSESKSEVLKCYADWSEGNIYYMIGRLEHASNVQDRGRFRCFVYEKSADGTSIQLAQSTDESCYGMINPNEGPKILHLTAKPPAPHKCSFSSFIRNLSENWPSVDNSLVYWFNQDSSKYSVKETLGGSVIEEAVCLQQFNYPPSSRINQQQTSTQTTTTTASNRKLQTTTTASTYNQVSEYPHHHPRYVSQASSSSSSSDAVYLVQITKSCHTTNYCVRFYKRSDGIVQIDYFNTSRLVGQCRNAFFELPQTQIITSTTLDSQRCPLEGGYSIEAPMESYLTYNPSNIFLCPRQSYLTAQCDYPSRLRIHSRCSQGKSFVKNLHCLGSWTSNGLVRLLLADDDRQRYSAWYKDSTASLASLQDGSPGALPHQQPAQPANSLAPIIDLHLALITPPTSITRTMHVRLTRRNQCADLMSPESRASGSSSGTGWASLPFYAPPSSAGNQPTLSSMLPLLPIVTLLFMSWLSFSSPQLRQHLHLN